MGLRLNVSNSLNQLVDYLCDDLAKPLNDVFQPHYIVTQTLGMNNWLKVQLADRLGITANCRFLKPNDMVAQLYFILGGRKEQVLSVDGLQWILFDLLDEPAFKKQFSFIANYYRHGDDVKRVALAEKVADLFDQYQIYRPEMILEWSNFQGGLETLSNWQQYLWIEAKRKIGVKMPDKTMIGRSIIESLHQLDKQQKLKDKISHLHVFGLSIITAYHLEVFQEVAKYIDISFHLLNPAPSQYWFEDKSGKQIAYWKKKRGADNFAPPMEGNALLAHWGKVIQDTFSFFFKNEDFLNEYNDEITREPFPSSLLTKIQNDIFHNAVGEERNTITMADLQDRSLTFHSCYTPSREVEVLYNYLVHLVVESGERLSPRDIVVMVSDIDSYAPYIKAIFTSAPYFFPFTIADERMHSEDGLFSVLQAFMALHEENFKAEEVLQLLEFDAVRKRFQVTDIALIRKVVRAANIRFGIAGRVDDDTITVSWLNGLNRIMYGICMSGEEEYQVQGYGIYPVDMVEGAEALELIRFCHFVQVLIDLVNEQKKEQSLAEWGRYVMYAVSQLLFYPEEQDNEDYHFLVRYLEQLDSLAEDLPAKIDFLVFKQSFLKKIADETRSGNFASGGITFCSLIPMRSIPFKVVALLGLNFDKFPRKESAISFDLLGLHPKRGDRNVKNNDKHLFLETLLSAQDCLYISYIGRNVKNNDPLPPSALVDELIDYIQQGVENETARDELVTNHPLHGYSRRYAGNDSKLFTYLGYEEERINPKLQGGGADLEYSKFDLISIPHFIDFFKNPFKAYYQRVLDVNYHEEDSLLANNECFELNALQRWQLKQDLLFIDNPETYRDKAIKTGALPLKNMAKVAIDDILQSVIPVRELLGGGLAYDEEQVIDIEVQVEDTLFKGRIDRVFDNQQLFVAFSKDQYKYLLEAYIKHVFAIAAGQLVDTVYVSEKDQQLYTIDRHHIGRENALGYLKSLLTLYKSAWECPLLYSPAFENNPLKLEKMDAAAFRDDLRKRIMDAFFTINDPYIHKEYEGGFFDQEDVFDRYYQNWQLIFSPVIEAFPMYFQRKNKA